MSKFLLLRPPPAEQQASTLARARAVGPRASARSRVRIPALFVRVCFRVHHVERSNEVGAVTNTDLVDVFKELLARVLLMRVVHLGLRGGARGGPKQKVAARRKGGEAAAAKCGS